MLLIAKSLRGLSFPKLMEVYVEGNRENGGDRYPGEPRTGSWPLQRRTSGNTSARCFLPQRVPRISSLRRQGATSAPCAWSPMRTASCWRPWKPPRKSAERAMPPA